VKQGGSSRRTTAEQVWYSVMSVRCSRENGRRGRERVGEKKVEVSAGGVVNDNGACRTAAGGYVEGVLCQTPPWW